MFDSDSDISDGMGMGKFYNNLDFTEDKYDGRKDKGGPKRRQNCGLNRLQNNVKTLKNIIAPASSGSPSSASIDDELLGSFMNTKKHGDNSFRQCL